MTVLCNLGSELQSIMKMFNQNFFYHEIVHFKVGTFFGFSTSKSLSPRLLEISRNFEISFFHRFSSTYDMNNKKWAKMFELTFKIGIKKPKNHIWSYLQVGLCCQALFEKFWNYWFWFLSNDQIKKSRDKNEKTIFLWDMWMKNVNFIIFYEN